MSVNTLQGRMLIFVVLFIGLLLTFSAVILWQNRQTNFLTRQLESLDTRKLIILSQMLAGIEEITSLHQLYVLNAKASYKRQRVETWQAKIDSSLLQINEIQLGFKDDEFLTEKIPLLKTLVSDFKSAIAQSDVVIEENISNLQAIIPENDSSEIGALLDESRVISHQIGLKISEEVLPAKDKLKTLLLLLLENNDKITRLHVDQVQSKTNWSNIFTIYIMVFSILISVAFAFYNAFRLTESINKPTELIRRLSNGEIPEQMESTHDELAHVVEASNLLSDNLKNASLFAKSIGDGKFDFEFSPVSEKDVLGNSLIQMRKKLQEVAEEDKKRNWVTQGLAKFAEIIRSNNLDFKSLGENTLAALIEYLEANQGGIFIVNPGENEATAQLDMIACYAYDRKKYFNKQIIVHNDHAESLLGQVYLEKEKIYLQRIPEDYLSISSGLGEAPARYLLIFPLKLNHAVEGVLEIASLHEFEDYQIEFIEKICESIAAAISSIKISERTRQLVKELQDQTDIMRTQEEGMRKNMEELTVTQEEMAAKQHELEKLKENLETEVKNRTQELEESLSRFNLIIQSASEGLWDMVIPQNGFIDLHTEFLWSKNLKISLGYTDEEFPNVLDSWATRLHPEDREKVFREFIQHVKDKTGNSIFLNEHRLMTKSGEYRWFRASCQSLRDEEGNALRVAGYINDISNQKQLDIVLNELTSKRQELERSNEKMRTNTEVLEKALKKTKLKELELKKTNQMLEANEKRFKNITQNVPGIIYQFEHDPKTNQGRFTYVSDYVKKVLDYSAEEFLQFDMENLYQGIHPEDRTSYFEQSLASLQSLEGFVWEGRIADKAQNWKWIKIISTPRQVDDLIVFDGIFQDITESKLQEEELKRMTTEILIREEELRQNYEDLANMQFKNNIS